MGPGRGWVWGFVGVLLALVASWLLPVAAQDRWPEFEIPPGLEKAPQTGLAARFRKIRDRYVATNGNVGTAEAAQVLLTEVLVDQLEPSQLRMVSNVLRVLIDAGVIDVNTSQLTPEQIALVQGQLQGSGEEVGDRSGSVGVTRPLGASGGATHSRRLAAEDTPKCDCSGAGGQPIPPARTPAPAPRPPAPTAQAPPHGDACVRTTRGCSPKAMALFGQRMQVLRTIKAIGMAMRRAALAWEAYMFVKQEVGSYQHYNELTEKQEEDLRRRFAQEMLLSAKHFGLDGQEFAVYARMLGVEVPDLQHTPSAELSGLAEDWADHSAFENGAIKSGMNLTTQAFAHARDWASMALLKRIGIEPTPELIAAYGDLKDQVDRLNKIRRNGAPQSQYDSEAQAAIARASAAADAIAASLEGVNVTNVLITTTELLVAAEAVYNITNSTRPHSLDDVQPWRVVITLAELDEALNTNGGRRSFSIALKNDSALAGILLLNASDPNASPVLKDLNQTAIRGIMADGAIDENELRFIVQRIEALNQVYDMQDIVELMHQVENHYADMNGQPRPYGPTDPKGPGLPEVVNAVLRAQKEHKERQQEALHQAQQQQTQQPGQGAKRAVQFDVPATDGDASWGHNL